MDSVRIVIFNREGSDKFLILTETDDPENWKLPGGRFESEETPDEAAARELEEELGISKREAELTRAGKLLNDDDASQRFIYFGQTTPHDLKLGEDIASIKWTTLTMIPAGKNSGHIRSAVTLALGALTE